MTEKTETTYRGADRAVLRSLSAEWSFAKTAEKSAKQDAEHKRAEILGCFKKPEEAIGYEDEVLKISFRSEVEGATEAQLLPVKPDGAEQRKLHRALLEAGALGEVQVAGISVSEVARVAKKHPKVAEALGELYVRGPRFLQVDSKS